MHDVVAPAAAPLEAPYAALLPAVARISAEAAALAALDGIDPITRHQLETLADTADVIAERTRRRMGELAGEVSDG